MSENTTKGVEMEKERIAELRTIANRLIREGGLTGSYFREMLYALESTQAALSAARERIREMEALFPTNRHLHEEAAGMGLEDAFFRMNGIDPDARPAPSSRVAGEGLRPWQRFDGAPKDGSTFLALHSAWKVPVAIKWHPGASGMEGCDWITGTMDQTWPSIAFSGWMPMPDSLRAAKPSP